jgi:hypothetical protein
MINFLEEKLGRVDLAAVDQYSLVLGRVYRYLQLLFKLRRADIVLRREAFARNAKRREEIIQENERLAEEKERALLEYKEKLTPEELDSFDLEGWEAQFFETRQFQEVPDPEVEEVDDDYDLSGPSQPEPSA